MSHKLVASVPLSCKVVDLSADFRLADIPTYEEWCALLRRAARQCRRRLCRRDRRRPPSRSPFFLPSPAACSGA